VRVDEPGQDAAALRVHDGRVGGELQAPVPSGGGPDPHDLSLPGGNRGVLEQSERPLALGRLAGHQLPDAVHDQVCFDHLLIRPIE
jgi:hypothetical protein